MGYFGSWGWISYPLSLTVGVVRAHFPFIFRVGKQESGRDCHAGCRRRHRHVENDFRQCGDTGIGFHHQHLITDYRTTIRRRHRIPPHHGVVGIHLIALCRGHQLRTLRNVVRKPRAAQQDFSAKPFP